ncbi:AAA family ATPase [Albidovulum sediminis]|uniref:Helicase RepA family protein n=1 Tax=Albidovulum sediminis TaxID=3066345 RepID=A0ABT2NL70_9RHOB|nr:helicase RepA family protein [Defluviimonas sediminis]MCT8328265.1 helicase RepA family protein [Defluviimonas sediminis]
MTVDQVRQMMSAAEEIDPSRAAPGVGDKTVTPLRRGLADHAKRLLARIEFAGEISPSLDRDYVIKGWIDRGGLSIVYGDANAGKSFFAVDVAHHVHAGATWAGCKVRRGAVLYVAAEGGALFDNRLAARHANFMVLRGPIRFGGRGSDGPPLADTVRHLAEIHGPFALIIVDTLARTMAGDENTAPDVAALLRDLDLIRERTGAHVMVVHHNGKDASRGARGHSSLRAAVDTELHLSKDEDGRRLVRVTKQRDGETGLERRFTLKQVQLGSDADGDPVTTCIVQHEEREEQRLF